MDSYAKSTRTGGRMRKVVYEYALPRSYGGMRRFGLHGAMPHTPLLKSVRVGPDHLCTHKEGDYIGGC